MALPSQKLYILRAKLKSEKDKRDRLKEEIELLKEKDSSKRSISNLEKRLSASRKKIDKINFDINEVWQSFNISKKRVAAISKQIKAQEEQQIGDWPERPTFEDIEEEYVSSVNKDVNKYLVATTSALRLVKSKEQLGRAVSKLKADILTFNEKVESKVAKFNKKLDSDHKNYFEKAVNETLGKKVSKVVEKEGAPTKSIVDRRIRESIRLIKTIPEEHLDSVENLFRKALDNEMSQKELRNLLIETHKLPKWRAELILRDQTAKATSDLEKVRQENIGIKRYTWRTAGDKRVRKEHEENEGKVFSWDKPPRNTGHPGQDINCRCIAEPVLDDLF